MSFQRFKILQKKQGCSNLTVMQPDIDSILASILEKEEGAAIKAGIQNSESRIRNRNPESGNQNHPPFVRITITQFALLVFIHWLVIYPADSVIYLFNNQGLVSCAS